MTSVTVNQPLIQTSETHTSPYDDSVGEGWGVGRGVIMEGQRRLGLATHSKCLCVIIHPPREALHFYFQFTFYYGPFKTGLRGF